MNRFQILTFTQSKCPSQSFFFLLHFHVSSFLAVISPFGHYQALVSHLSLETQTFFLFFTNPSLQYKNDVNSVLFSFSFTYLAFWSLYQKILWAYLSSFLCTRLFTPISLKVFTFYLLIIAFPLNYSIFFFAFSYGTLS